MVLDLLIGRCGHIVRNVGAKCLHCELFELVNLLYTRILFKRWFIFTSIVCDCESVCSYTYLVLVVVVIQVFVRNYGLYNFGF